MPKGMPRAKHPELYGKRKSRKAKPRVKRATAPPTPVTPPEIHGTAVDAIGDYGVEYHVFSDAAWCWVENPLRLQIYNDKEIVAEIVAPFVKAVRKF